MPLTRFSKWTILYGVIAAEVAVMTGAYYVWHYMNTSQCYRRKMYENHPLVLEAFYKSCTVVGILGIKEKDFKVWKNEDK